jgi:hypothetical protein
VATSRRSRATRAGEPAPTEPAPAGADDAPPAGDAEADAVPARDPHPAPDAGADAGADADAGAEADADADADTGAVAETVSVPSDPPGPAPAKRARRSPRSRAARSRTRRAETPAREQRVAVVIPAKDESRRIAATVRAARAIPFVDLVLVVDDGSEDATQHVAREAGAVVVRHSHNRGKASAMETGAAVVAMRDVEDGPTRLLLFIDGDLGESAVNAAPLVPPVRSGEADATIALLPPQPGAGGRGIVVGLARRSVQGMTGWTPTQPLSGMRCLTRAAFEAATPLAHGWGVETGMTIDLLTQGFRILEVPCDLRHRPSGTDFRGQMHRAAQYRDVLLAVNARRVRRVAARVRRRVEED